MINFVGKLYVSLLSLERFIFIILFLFLIDFCFFFGGEGGKDDKKIKIEA